MIIQDDQMSQGYNVDNHESIYVRNINNKRNKSIVTGSLGSLQTTQVHTHNSLENLIVDAKVICVLFDNNSKKIKDTSVNNEINTFNSSDGVNNQCKSKLYNHCNNYSSKCNNIDKNMNTILYFISMLFVI